MDRVNKMTFVDVFIVIIFLEFFDANDFEEGVGQSKCRCVWCVGHSAHHTKFIQSSHQFHLGGIWGVSSSYGPFVAHTWITIFFSNFFISKNWRMFSKIFCWKNYSINSQNFKRNQLKKLYMWGSWCFWVPM